MDSNLLNDGYPQKPAGKSYGKLKTRGRIVFPVGKIGDWQQIICPGCKEPKIYWDGQTDNTTHWCDTCRNYITLA